MRYTVYLLTVYYYVFHASTSFVFAASIVSSLARVARSRKKSTRRHSPRSHPSHDDASLERAFDFESAFDFHRDTSRESHASADDGGESKRRARDRVDRARE